VLNSTMKDQKKARKDWETTDKSLRRYEKNLSKANSDYEDINFRDDAIDVEIKKLVDEKAQNLINKLEIYDNRMANSQEKLSVLRKQCAQDRHKVNEVTARLEKYIAIKEQKIEPQLRVYLTYYATISGKDLMEEEYGIPYCFEFGAKLSADIMMKLRKQMKYLGYPGVQKFRLSDWGTTKMWEEIAEAVGIQLPNQEDSIVSEVLKCIEEGNMDDSDEEQDDDESEGDKENELGDNNLVFHRSSMTGG
jgi:hypothetical protein